jgi:hypothetical protein
MNSNPEYSFLAQVETGQSLDSGLFEAANSVCLIDEELALAAMVTGHADLSTAPSKALQILQDDMRTNLAGTEVAECLRESLTNIHEYLQNTAQCAGDEGVGLVAIQAAHGEINAISAGGFRCLHVRQGKLSILLEGKQHGHRLGCRLAPEIEYARHAFEADDLVAVIATDDLELIGEDFIELTFRRFSDTPDVILRQINTRLSNRVHRRTPPMLFARGERGQPAKSGWFGGLFSG